MNKTELVAAAAAAAGVSKKDTEAVIKATLKAIEDTLAKEGKVQLIGFGTFEVRKRTARLGNNPRTGDKVKIAACKVPAFKPGQGLKDAVNK